MDIHKIEWNDRSTRWFLSASEYTGFHKNLLPLLSPLLPEGGTLCDLGCGTAMIDFLLAGRMASVTCVDRDPAVIRTVEEHIRLSGQKNMTALCGDARSISGQWDTVLLLFFGRIGEDDNLRTYLRLCRKNLIYVVRAGSRDGSDIRSNDRAIAFTSRVLDEERVAWRLIERVMEYGQPLQSLSDAREYAQIYAKNPPGEDLDAYLRRSLVETGDTLYPYYLPYQKHIGIFSILK